MIKRTPLRLYFRLVRRLFPGLVAGAERLIDFVSRGLYGWSVRDCWAADVYLAKLMINIIKWLKANKMGIPHDFVMMAVEKKLANVQDENLVDTAAELYNKMLDEIVEGLEAYLQMMDLDWEPGEDMSVLILQTQQLKRKFRKSMLLLARYFHSLGA